jgi:two-component system, chemotaxis family, chemotaxis protein CheY
MLQARKSLCVVDDDTIYQFTTARMVQIVDSSVDVLTFGDGEQAMRYINANAHDAAKLPDMILLDLNMPFMDGWEFLSAFEAIRDNLSKSIIIYVVSSSIDERDALRARSYGDVQDYLEKPVTTDRIRTLLSVYAKQPG